MSEMPGQKKTRRDYRADPAIQSKFTRGLQLAITAAESVLLTLFCQAAEGVIHLVSSVCRWHGMDIFLKLRAHSLRHRHWGRESEPAKLPNSTLGRELPEPSIPESRDLGHTLLQKFPSPPSVPSASCITPTLCNSETWVTRNATRSLSPVLVPRPLTRRQAYLRAARSTSWL